MEIIILEKKKGCSSLYICTYTILESPFPIENYAATIRLIPITDGDRTYIEWTAEFNCYQQEEESLVKNIGDGVFQDGFNSLKSIFNG